MGWHLVTQLKDGASLHTRRGLAGVFVRTADGKDIEIPEQVLRDLAAETLRGEKISLWEDV